MSKKYFIANTEKNAQFLAEHGEETGYIKVSNYKVFFNAHQELKKMEKEVEK